MPRMEEMLGLPDGDYGPNKLKRIEVTTPGQRSKFEEWIKDRGGVIVWVNINLSDPGAGNIFTPATTKEGTPGRDQKPRWSHEYSETITDITRFRFVKELKEVKRFRVAVRTGGNGLSVKCTDGATRRIRAACAKFSTETVSALYEFDYETQEAVILVPVWED